MSSFDERLAARLRGLDAAIPAPKTIDPRILNTGAATRRGRSLGVPRKVLLLVAAALAVGCGLIAGGALNLSGEQPEPGLEAALAKLFFAQDCLGPAEAEAKVRALFGPLGYDGWRIERTPAVRDDDCVAAAVDAQRQTVLLMPGVSRAAAAKFDALQQETLDGCFGRDAALELVRTGLASVGVMDVAIAVDTGEPQSLPGDEAEAARWRRHVANGCYVLEGGASWDEAGNKTIYLWGNK